MVIWMSTINSSLDELLDHLKNNDTNTEDSKSFEKKLNIIEEGLKNKIELKDDLNVSSLIDIVKLLYLQCKEKDETIRDLNEKDELNKDRISSQKAQIENLTNVRHTFELKIQELESINEDNNLQIKELNQIIQKKSVVVENLKQQVTELSEANDANEYEYNVKVSQLENQIERITNSESLLKAELEKRIDNANFEKDNLRSVITKEQEKVMNLSKENDDLKIENKRLNNKIKEYECKFLEVEDLANLYEECAEDKKHLETELHSYRELVSDPSFQKNDLLYGEGEGINDVSTDKSETLKEELEKVNKTIDEENSEIISIHGTTSGITKMIRMNSANSANATTSANDSEVIITSDAAENSNLKKKASNVAPIQTKFDTATSIDNNDIPVTSATIKITDTATSPINSSTPIPTPNTKSKITEDPDILSLIEERQKKYAASIASNSHLDIMKTMDTKEKEEEENENQEEINYINNNVDNDHDGDHDGDDDDDDYDEYNEANLSFVSVNSSIFDDNSSFFLENDVEYKQAMAAQQQQFLQPPNSNNLKPPKSPTLGAFMSPILSSNKSSNLCAPSSTLMPPPLKLSGNNKIKTSGKHRKRSKSEPAHHNNYSNLSGKPSNIIPKLNSITAFITSILEKIKETELKTLNLQLKKSFDMVELTSLSNKILQNILSDIEHLHKRYPLTTNGTVTNDNVEEKEENYSVSRSTSLKFKTTSCCKMNNGPSKLVIEVTEDNDDDIPQKIDEEKEKEEKEEKEKEKEKEEINKKKYTEDSIAIHNLVLILQNILNELCLARMLTNDYGKLYFQALEKASQKEAEKFLYDKKQQNSPSKDSKSKSKSKSNSKSKLENQSIPAVEESQSREIPIRSSGRLTKSTSLKDIKLFKSLKNIFKDSKEETKSKISSTSSSSSLQASKEASTSSQPSLTKEINSSSSEKPEEENLASSSSLKENEEKKSEKSSNFMDFFKFKLNKSSIHDEEKEKEKEKKNKKNKGNYQKEEKEQNENKELIDNNNDNKDNNNNNNNNNSNILNVDQTNNSEILTNVSDILFTVTAADDAVLSDEQQEEKIKSELLNENSIIANIEEFSIATEEKENKKEQEEEEEEEQEQENLHHNLPPTIPLNENNTDKISKNSKAMEINNVPDEDIAFSYNSSDISFASSGLDTLPVRTSTTKSGKYGAMSTILSSSPYYHADTMEKSFPFENSKFLNQVDEDDALYTPIKKNIR